MSSEERGGREEDVWGNGIEKMKSRLTRVTAREGISAIESGGSSDP